MRFLLLFCLRTRRLYSAALGASVFAKANVFVKTTPHKSPDKSPHTALLRTPPHKLADRVWGLRLRLKATTLQAA